MYTRFNVSLGDSFFTEENYKKGTNLYKEVKRKVSGELNEIIRQSPMNGNRLQEIFFPDKIFLNEKFIFISHSHQDEKIAVKLAGYLSKEFGIPSFVDSCVWGNMDDLVKLLDKYNTDGTFSDTGSKITRNINYAHMMLASALLEMISVCECMFFLHTPLSANSNQRTESPWIHYELTSARALQRISCITESAADPWEESVDFRTDLKKMTLIDEKMIEEWKAQCDKETDPFKVLYRVCGIHGLL